MKIAWANGEQSECKSDNPIGKDKAQQGVDPELSIAKNEQEFYFLYPNEKITLNFSKGVSSLDIELFMAENRSKMNEVEQEFVESIFYPFAGDNGLEYLQVQTPIVEPSGKRRKLDFTLKTNRFNYVIEIDGYTYHAEGALRVSPDYFDDLLVKQNNLVLNNYKLIRFSYNQIMREPGLCVDTLRRAFKSDPELNPMFVRGKDEIEPTYPQKMALENLDYYYGQGKRKGIIVMATGLGKTFLSALWAKNFDGKILFVAHLTDLVTQAMDAFDVVFPDVKKGLVKGPVKETTERMIFASKDTLYREGNLELFSPEEFDLIIIDEVHHSACRTYREIIDYFCPQFMLGMTATPERQDRADILELFDYNLFFEMGQREAIESGYLTGFKYYGLKDNIDYSQIRHNGRRYDVSDLGVKLSIPERNEAIVRKFKDICPDAKALGFCVTIDHAIETASFFNQAGIGAAAIHSDTSRLPVSRREQLVKDFRENYIQILFTVDAFNEGVDFPDVEALLFLRPTESKTIFTQQLGRGLRLSPYKEHVVVLDFIGNFINAERIKDYLSGSVHTGSDGDGGEGQRSSFLPKEYLRWPLGCDVYFEQEVEELLGQMAERSRELTKDDLIENYFGVKEQIKRKPSRDDINDLSVSSYKVSRYDALFGSWSRFLSEIGEATQASYHYPQGTHLGHILYIVYSLGEKKLCERLSPDTYSPLPGNTLTTLGRQTRYKLWACMELGLIQDDRDPENVGNREVYQILTKEGQVLYRLIKQYIGNPDDYFRFNTTKAEVSWSMEDEEKYPEFIKNLPPQDLIALEGIFFKMDAVQHMLKYLFHVNQGKTTFKRKEIYSSYFDAPHVKHYFEIHGIVQDSAEGAARRLPFILNILEAFGVVSFPDRSTIKIVRLPMVPCLFSEDDDDCGRENINAVLGYYTEGNLPDDETLAELRTLLGKSFMTPDYPIPV